MRGIGELGEIAVRQRFEDDGWYVSVPELNNPNFDFTIHRGHHLLNVEVKTISAGDDNKSHRHCINLGMASSYRTHGRAFNRLPGREYPDLVVSMIYRPGAPVYVVLPVAVAEKVAFESVQAWLAVPKRDGSVRSDGFRIYPRFLKEDAAHPQIYGPLRKVLLNYEDAWHLATTPRNNLHDLSFWADAAALSLGSWSFSERAVLL